MPARAGGRRTRQPADITTSETMARTTIAGHGARSWCWALANSAQLQATHCREEPTYARRWCSPRDDERLWRVWSCPDRLDVTTSGRLTGIGRFGQQRLVEMAPMGSDNQKHSSGGKRGARYDGAGSTGERNEFGELL